MGINLGLIRGAIGREVELITKEGAYEGKLIAVEERQYSANVKGFVADLETKEGVKTFQSVFIKGIKQKRGTR
jgi:hypothetical protein